MARRRWSRVRAAARRRRSGAAPGAEEVARHEERDESHGAACVPSYLEQSPEVRGAVRRSSSAR